MSYFDINENSPGGLLTKLSIDTTQLNALILSVFGSVISTFATLVTGFVISFIYDWKLTLISTGVFVPDETIGCEKDISSNWGGSRYLPYAYTEQGIYMLTSVLRGQLAIKQSKVIL